MNRRITWDRTHILWLVNTDEAYRLIWVGKYSYYVLFSGSYLDCLLTLDRLAYAVGFTDHTRSVLYMKYEGKLPSNIKMEVHNVY